MRQATGSASWKLANESACAAKSDDALMPPVLGAGSLVLDANSGPTPLRAALEAIRELASNEQC